MIGSAVAAALCVLAACSSGDDGARRALQGYLDAMKAKDYKTVVDGMHFKGEVTPEEKDVYVAMLSQKVAEMEKTEASVKEYEVTGDSIIVPDSLAIVFYDVTYEDGDKDSGDQKMVKVDGKWLMESGK